jgi:hypothetical protein
VIDILKIIRFRPREALYPHSTGTPPVHSLLRLEGDATRSAKTTVPFPR